MTLNFWNGSFPKTYLLRLYVLNVYNGGGWMGKVEGPFHLYVSISFTFAGQLGVYRTRRMPSPYFSSSLQSPSYEFWPIGTKRSFHTKGGFIHDGTCTHRCVLDELVSGRLWGSDPLWTRARGIVNLTKESAFTKEASPLQVYIHICTNLLMYTGYLVFTGLQYTPWGHRNPY